MPASLSAIQRYNVDHLLEGATYWESSHQAWITHFSGARQEVQGLGWQGPGGEGALVQSVRDENTAYDAAMVAQAAGASAQTSAASLMFLKQTVLGYVEAAQAAGFEVNDDLSVQDTMRTYPNASMAIARQRQAEIHAADIGYAAQALQAHDAQVAATLQAHSAALQAVQFADGHPIGS
jgi:hypothetical protein